MDRIALRRAPWIIPTLIFAILVILGAKTHPLWGDEAETALFARNILKYGVPKGWDGTNIMGINNAVVLNNDLVNHTSPWGQYYLTAASFALFGQSSFTARLPFMVLSVLSLPLLYYLSLHLTKRPKVALLSVIIMSFSVPYTLFAFQARHYPLSIFAGLVWVFSCLFLTKRSFLPKITFIAGGTLLFYSNYIVFVAFFSAAFFAAAMYHRRTLGRFVLWFGIGSAVIAALAIPWYIAFKPFEGRGVIVLESFDVLVLGFVTFLQSASYPYNDNNGLPVLFLPLLLFVVVRRLVRREDVRPMFFPGIIVGLFLLVMIFITTVAFVDTIFVHVRYTMIIFPYLSIIVAILLADVWQWYKGVGLVVLALYLATNVFTLQPLRSFPVEYFTEILYPYDTPDKVVADYIARYAKVGDTAFVSLDRDHEPLIFHLKDTIRFVNRVSLINTRIFPKNRGIIPRYIYDFRESPDWVILYSKRGDDGTFLTFDYRPLPREINLARDYEETALPVFFADMSRPEMELRSFREIKPKYQDQVFIYKKIQ